MARHTRARGARSSTRFSMRSVLAACGVDWVLAVMCSSPLSTGSDVMQPLCCISYVGPGRCARGMLRFEHLRAGTKYATQTLHISNGVAIGAERQFPHQ